MYTIYFSAIITLSWAIRPAKEFKVDYEYNETELSLANDQELEQMSIVDYLNLVEDDEFEFLAVWIKAIAD